MRHSIAAKIARGAAIVLACLLAAELGLRAVAVLSGRAIERGRDDPMLLGNAQVAVYGDSTPFGLGASTSFPAELARLTGLRVVNRSRPGINSAQTLLVLRDDLERYSPPLVLVMTGANDVWNPEDVDPELLPTGSFWMHRLPELRLYRMARIWWVAGPGASAFETVRGSGWSEREETARSLGAQGARRITRENLKRIAALVRGTSARILFLGYPTPGWNDSATSVDAILREDHTGDWIPMRDLFTGEGEGEALISPDNFHPTAEGHHRIAERVRSELAARGLP